MRALLVLGVLSLTVQGADVESRILTHYIPQDLLETTVRTEGWTKIPLAVPGGVRKGDVIRLWAGGSIDRGNGDQPGQNVGFPTGLEARDHSIDGRKLALSPDPTHAFALLVKTDNTALRKCPGPGKSLELTLAKDQEQLSLGFNDERGRYQDNHLGKGRRHEFDPLWVRIEVVRLIVD